MKAEYEKLLELEGVPMAQLINASKTKSLSCHGAYRRIIAMPKDIEWYFFCLIWGFISGN